MVIEMRGTTSDELRRTLGRLIDIKINELARFTGNSVDQERSAIRRWVSQLRTDDKDPELEREKRISKQRKQVDGSRTLRRRVDFPLNDLTISGLNEDHLTGFLPNFRSGVSFSLKEEFAAMTLRNPKGETEVAIFSLATGEKLAVTGRHAIFSPTENLLAITKENLETQIYEIPSLKLLSTFPMPLGTNPYAFGRDWALTRKEDQSHYVLYHGKDIALEFDGPSVFDAKSRRLAYIDANKTLQLFDIGSLGHIPLSYSFREAMFSTSVSNAETVDLVGPSMGNTLDLAKGKVIVFGFDKPKIYADFRIESEYDRGISSYRLLIKSLDGSLEINRSRLTGDVNPNQRTGEVLYQFVDSNGAQKTEFFAPKERKLFSADGHYSSITPDRKMFYTVLTYQDYTQVHYFDLRTGISGSLNLKKGFYQPINADAWLWTDTETKHSHLLSSLSLGDNATPFAEVSPRPSWSRSERYIVGVHNKAVQIHEILP